MAENTFREVEKETANQIADIYMNQLKRTKEYYVDIYPFEISHEGYYRDFSEEDLEKIRKCKAIAIEEDIPLDEILESEYSEINDKALEYINWSGYNDNDDFIPFVHDIDIDNPVKFCSFEIIEIDKNQDIAPSRYCSSAPIDDNEYKELLVELMINANRYSMNMLVYNKPELAKKIINHLVRTSWDGYGDNFYTFAIELKELKNAVERILNPFIDQIGIFNCDNESYQTFAHRHQIIPGDENFSGIYSSNVLTVSLSFEGTKIVFSKGEHKDFESKYVSFSVNAYDVIKKFSLKGPQDIIPYIKDHYNIENCYETLKRDLKVEND